MSQVIKLKQSSDTNLTTGGVLVEASVVRITNTGSTTQFLDVFNSTNSYRTGRHIILQYETVYLHKEKDEYLRSGTSVRAVAVSVEG